MDSAYKNLVSVRDLREGALPENRLFSDAHRLILQSDPDDHEDISELPLWHRQVGLALYVESTLPVRIVLGYHGFATESSFRDAFVTFLEGRLQTRGYGAADLPNLIVCDKYSLVKLNGMPYGLPIADSREKLYAAYGIYNLPDEAPVKGNLWVLCASYAHNPMILLLELIWTRLTYSKRLSSSVYGLDLQVEILRPLLLAKAIEQNGQVGWYYEHFNLSQPVLDRIPAIANWEPTELTLGQFIVLMHLIIQENAGMAGMDINTPAMLEELQENSFSATECIAYLRQAGLVSLEGNTLRLLTRQCDIGCLPDGRVVVGENASLRFSNWVMNYMKIHRSRDNQKARPTLHAPDQANRGSNSKVVLLL